MLKLKLAFICVVCVGLGIITWRVCTPDTESNSTESPSAKLRTSEGDTEKVFEPFHSTKATGSGLGLAVTRKIIESHSGSITIKSEKNKGTCVTIMLPT